MEIDEKLKELEIKLPSASNPATNSTNCVRTGELHFVSGKGPLSPSTVPPKGKLGKEFSTEQGYEFARITGLDILAAVKLELGSRSNVGARRSTRYY